MKIKVENAYRTRMEEYEINGVGIPSTTIVGKCGERDE